MQNIVIRRFNINLYLFKQATINKKMNKSLINLFMVVLCIGMCMSIPYKMKQLHAIPRPQVKQNIIIDKQTIPSNEVQEPSAKSSASNILWPLPKNINSNPQPNNLTISPCSINYKINAPSPSYVQQILNIYLIQVFHCSQQPKSNITLLINIKNTDVMVPTIVGHEKYTLILRENTTSTKWEIDADYYPGFLRALETFSQLFEERLNINNQKQLFVRDLPIIIDDQPDYIWRGLMIDSSRHFQPVETIKKMIDGLMFNKMNVLHWHITDEDSFPLEIDAFPELAKYGKVGGTYSQKDVKSLIQYAKTRGVRLIPQIDTPAHTQSWGRSPQLADIILDCNGQYEGQFDPTLPKTYETVRRVMEHINSSFSDSYVHFGGDEIILKCFDQRPQIKTRMAALNISDYRSLQIYYRQQQKKLWRQISPSKKVIYWANEQIDLPLDNDDVIHWWGVSKNVDKLKGRKNQVILSNYDLTYLDIGFGNRYGNSYGTYENWRTLYTGFNTKVDTVNVIGATVCAWSEIINPSNIQTKVWIRTSAMAERLWYNTVPTTPTITNIATRLHAQSERMRARGFKVSPVTVGLCEADMSICFG